jgi:hypothetical protein
LPHCIAQGGRAGMMPPKVIKAANAAMSLTGTTQ